MTGLPEYLFAARAEYDVEQLSREGLTAASGGMVLLYLTPENAEAATGPAETRCLIMVHVERMVGDGYVLTAAGDGVWHLPAVPPRYLWLSERQTG